MLEKNFSFKDSQGVDIFVYKWEPEQGVNIKGVVQIAHGMAEHAKRYGHFAEKLTSSGYIVYANDHRGHGKTAESVEKIGYCGEDGFTWKVKDMKQLTSIIKKENPKQPVYLFGHSMGSLLSQTYMFLYGEELKGVILSGTSGKQGVLVSLGILIAKGQVKKLGPEAPSLVMDKMSFGKFNDRFKPIRTKFDWLNRDEKEVDKYIEDPLCGGVFSAGFFYDFLNGVKNMHKKENMAKIPKTLPIFLIAGDKDPVGKECKTISSLIQAYKKLGIKDVNYKFYKDARHEILNEINKEEVMRDVINWLNIH